MAGRQTAPKKEQVAVPRRGDIFVVAFDPTVGAEIRKTRPALVIQNDIANRYSPVTIVAALTSKFSEPPYPTEVILEPSESGLRQRSCVLLNQVRTVDRQRLVKRLGQASDAIMARIDRGLLISLGLVLKQEN